MPVALKSFERLPKSVVPVNYDLTIKPDLNQLVFEGTEDVTLKVNSLILVIFQFLCFNFTQQLEQYIINQVVDPVDEIVLNSLDLELSDAVVIIENGEKMVVNQVDLDPKNEKAIFKLPSTLQPGLVHLKLNFKGVILDKLKGFYRTKYTRYSTKVEKFPLLYS